MLCTYQLNRDLENRPLTQLSSGHHSYYALKIWPKSLHQNFSLVIIRFLRYNLWESWAPILIQKLKYGHFTIVGLKLCFWVNFENHLLFIFPNKVYAALSRLLFFANYLKTLMYWSKDRLYLFALLFYLQYTIILLTLQLKFLHCNFQNVLKYLL